MEARISHETGRRTGSALKSGDRGKVTPAFGKVGGVCHDCHVRYMLGSGRGTTGVTSSAIRTKDPLSNEEMPFTRLKQNLDSNFAGSA